MLNGKKIYVSSCGGVGDLIMFTPALREIKNKYPDVQITFLTAKHNVDAIKGLPYIENVIYIERGKSFGRLGAIKALRGIDFVVFTDWQPQLAIAAWLFGIPVRAGIPKPGHRANLFLNRILKENVMHSEDYAAHTNGRIFSEALGIPNIMGNGKPEVALPREADIASVTMMLKKHGIALTDPFFCLTPFAGLEQRNWPLVECERWIRAVEKIYNVPVVILGPQKYRESGTVLGGVNLLGETTLIQMVEIIRRAKLHVGPDSGPMHIAGALGTPTIALFSKDIPSRWAPKEKCIPLTLSLECAPCSDQTARKCINVPCMRGITSAMVKEATVKLLEMVRS